MSETGQPASGWFPEQRISRLAALRSFTRGAAASLGAPLPAGTLAPGARADLTIWAEDPLRVAPRDLLHIGIRGCVVAGQVHLTADA
jgi:predicted amidohydrolase YtcJ